MKIVNVLIKLKIFLVDQDSAPSVKTWKVWAVLLNKPKPSMSANIDYLAHNMVSLKCTKCYSDTLVCGDKSKMSISYLIKDMPSLNMSIDVWPSLPNKLWPIKP